MEAFNERLKRLREAAGMSQDGLAKAAGLTVSTVSKLEQRVTSPSWATVQAIAKGLRVGVEVFADAEVPKRKSSQKKARGRKGAK